VKRCSRTVWRALPLLLVALVPALTVVDAVIAKEEAAPDAQQVDELELDDGSVIRGQIESIDAETIIIVTRLAGRLTIERANVREIRRSVDGVAPATRLLTDPDYNTVMLTPTPETLNAGDAYFRNFELFFINVGYSPSDAVDLSAGSLIPMAGDFVFGTFGAKVRILSREKAPVGLALTGSILFADEDRLATFGGVIGIGNRERSLNLAVNRSESDGDESGVWFMLAADTRFTNRSKLIIEYANSTEAIGDDEEDDFNGMINLGIRWFGERMSFTLSGIRPLEATGDGFLLFPLAMFSVHN
jgi:hypothetical protein